METDHWKTLCAGVDNAYLILEEKNIAGLKQKPSNESQLQIRQILSGIDVSLSRKLKSFLPRS
mgnify:CR=1 FL=1